ncbi:MAG: ABC transporter substrate-binding protein, partial [Bacteroidetes bacterium]|nr:ABC transporter substrate-binding protein [Bacteroidota bacterium]
MKRYIIPIVSLLLLLIACDTGQQTGKTSAEKIKAAGSRFYGGTFRFNLTEPYQTLFPHSITDVMSSHIATQIYEGLVKFNPQDLSIMPCLAEKWEIDSSGTIYTFYLKKGVTFHDDVCFENNKGREVKAQDFKFSFELLCTSSWDNLLFQQTFKDKVVGANQYYNATVEGEEDIDLEGVKVIDDYTLQITLEKPSYSFIYILAHPATSVIAQEAFRRYGIDSRIGTGPFIFTQETDAPWKLYLVKNKNYHRYDTLGNRLPFLDSVIVSFISTQKAELAAFQDGKLEVITGLPGESILKVLEEQIAYFQSDNPKFLLDRSPKMTTHYYEFNTRKGIFKDIRIRKAFSYAIDRDEILDNVLKGQGLSAGIYGITPPSFKGYDIS